TLTPTYTPGAGDAGNVVTLTLTVDGNGSCADAVDTKELMIYEQPVADADGSAGAGTYETCGLSYVLGGVQSVSGSTGQWRQLSGPGTARSEERRVGKEWTSAGERRQEGKKTSRERDDVVRGRHETRTYSE